MTSIYSTTQASVLKMTPGSTPPTMQHNYLMGNTSETLNLTSPNATELMPTGYLSGYNMVRIITASVLVTALMIVIVVGNGMVILATAIDRNLRPVQNWFIASLAVSDLLVGLLIMPLSLTNELMGYWIFGKAMCELWLATDVLLCTASILNLCLISLDRYWSITRAITYVKFRTNRRAAMMIVIVWVLSAIICFPPLVGWKRPQPTKFGLPLCVLSEDTGYILYSTLGSFYIPLIVMVVVYFKIYLAARSRARRNLKKPKFASSTNNCKKPPPSPITGTTGTEKADHTTTSFSNPTKPIADVIDDDLARLSPLPSHGDDSPHVENNHANTNGKENHELTVPSATEDTQCPEYRSGDEERKLLGDETDSACESPVKRPGVPASVNKLRLATTGEDTDSMSDTQTLAQQSQKFNRNYASKPQHYTVVNEENSKPLLATDSNVESDATARENDMYRNNNVQEEVSAEEGVSGSRNSTSTDYELSKGEKHNNKGSKLGKLHPKMILLSPRTFRKSRKRSKNRDKSAKTHDDPERQKRKIARAKERRAILVLGIIMATFILSWLPFFSTYVISSLTGTHVPGMVFAVFFWAGYCNSALNPVVYTIFSQEFRKAFHKIICGRR